MNSYKDIDNTRYVISRVFSENKTTSMLIEQRMLEIKNKTPSLTDSGGMIYNNSGGSIQSKEGL